MQVLNHLTNQINECVSNMLGINTLTHLDALSLAVFTQECIPCERSHICKGRHEKIGQ